MSATIAILKVRGKRLTQAQRELLISASERPDVDLEDIPTIDAAKQFLDSIGHDLQNAYDKRLRRARDRYLKAILDPDTMPEQLREIQFATSVEICEILELMKQNNGGVLPEKGPYHDWWRENGC